MRLPTSILLYCACLTLVLASSLTSRAQAAERAPDPIPVEEIASLEEELKKAGEASSSLRKRRAYKNVVRDGEDLLKKSSVAATRFRVLEIVFRSQKRLVALDNSQRNREALLETSRELAQAPDQLADLRLEADMLLSESELSAKNADLQQRTQALAALIERYRDTPGEAKSLMMASLIAPKLEAFELEKAIFRAMDDRFAGDYDLIEWRRKNHGYAHERVLFTGTLERVDGTSLRFPMDGIGHTCVMVFWSKDTPGIASQLGKIQDLEARFPGWIDVFSFNVDELEDGGKKMLRPLGLDWTAMQLPGGRKSQIYRVVARQDPMVVRVNAHGHAFLPSALIDKLLEEVSMEQNFDDPRYLSQLQSLLVGEFLLPPLSPAPETGTDPDHWIREIEDCFVAAPLRYRLSRSQALANYRKAERLCREAISRYSQSPDLWRVRNFRITALLGMWKLGFEPKHLEAAVSEARSALAAPLPGGADLVPRFCLARNALRERLRAPRLVLGEFIQSSGGDEAPAAAHAAAAILAMDVNAGELHAIHREQFLADPGDDPASWPAVSFLRDQNHRFRMFQYNYYMPASRARRIVRANLRSNAAKLDAPADTSGPLQAEFKMMDGGRRMLSDAIDHKLTLLMFVEPPAGPDGEFPVLIQGEIRKDEKGRVIQTKGVMERAFEFAGQHVHQELKVIAAFLTDDTDRVQVLMEKHQWPCEVVLVPGGLTNPLVRRLGILSADRVPNIVLLRPEGTIAWQLSGLVHPQVRSEGINETLNVIGRAMKNNIERFEIERSLAALEQGLDDEAVRLFSGPFAAPERPSPDGWTAPRFHGRAIAHMRLGNREAALADLDAAIEMHQWLYHRKKPVVCSRVASLHLVRAGLLQELGRSDEAGGARQLAEAVKIRHPVSRYELLHRRIDALAGKEKE